MNNIETEIDFEEVSAVLVDGTWIERPDGYESYLSRDGYVTFIEVVDGTAEWSGRITIRLDRISAFRWRYSEVLHPL